MAIAADYREAVKNNPPPPAAEIRKRAEDYMACAGMGYDELAHEIGYSRPALRHFFAGRYAQLASTDIYLRDALAKYMEARPLAGGDDDIPAKLIPSWDTKLILECCDIARERSKVIAIEGPPGTSKTAILNWYAAHRNELRRNDAFAFRATTQMSGMDVLRRIGERLGIPVWRARGRVLRSVVRKLRQARPCVVLIDEAQHLTEFDVEPFEALRDVIDMAHCGCVLAGNFSFLKVLSNGLGQRLEQWLSRIPIRKHLRGLQRDELGRVAREYFGEAIDEPTIELIAEKAKAPDRNAFLRGRLAAQKFDRKYLNFRRVRNLFEEAERLRALPGNEQASLAGLVRAAAKEMMEAM